MHQLINTRALYTSPLAELSIPTSARLLGAATVQLLCEEYSFTCSPLSIAKYSSVQLGELWQRGLN